MPPQTGQWLIGAGLVLLAAGLVFYFFQDKLGWLGHLPGDFRIERPGFRFYFPLATMVLLSLLLNAVLWLIRRFF